MGRGETWLRDEKNKKRDRLTGEGRTSPAHRQLRGFGGVAVIVNPLLKQEEIGALEGAPYQCLTIQVLNVHITTAYLSPSARKADETSVLKYIGQMYTCSSIVICDFIARHRQWDTVGNE